MMDSNIYQMIFDEVSVFATEEWEKIVIYLEYGANSYSYAFYIKEGDKYTKCYSLPNVNEDELMNAFRRIDVQLSKERSATNATWTNMTMVIDSELNIKTDFDYSDLTENAYQYSKDWKSKYLN